MDWQSVYNSFSDPDSYHIGKVLCDACKGSLRFAPKDLIETRGLICKDCQFKNRFGFCQKCGCKISWKIGLLKSKCPLGEW